MRFSNALPVLDTIDLVQKVWQDSAANSVDHTDSTDLSLCDDQVTHGVSTLGWADVLAGDFSWLTDAGGWDLTTS